MNEKVKKLLDHAKVAEVENAYIGYCLHKQVSFITAKLSMTLRLSFTGFFKTLSNVERFQNDSVPFVV